MYITINNILNDTYIIGNRKNSRSFSGCSQENNLQSRAEIFAEYEANLKKAEIERNKLAKELSLKKFQDCKKEFEAGKISQALEMYKEIYTALKEQIMQTSAYSEYLETGGDLYGESGDFEEAEKFYCFALGNINKNNRNEDISRENIIRNKLAQNFILKGDTETANKILDKLLPEINTPEELVNVSLTKMLATDFTGEDISGFINLLNTVQEVHSLKPNFYLQYMTAMLYNLEGEPEASNNIIDDILTEMNKLGDNNSKKYAETMKLRGENYYDIAQNDVTDNSISSSLECYKKALKVVEDNQYSEMKDTILLNIGQIYYDKQNWDEAKSYLSQISITADTNTTKKCLELSGNIAIEKKDYKNAIGNFELLKNMEIAEDNESEKIGKIFEKLISISKLNGDNEKMQRYIEDCQKLQTSENRSVIAANYDDLIYMGNYNLDNLNNPQKAEECFENAMDRPDISDLEKVKAKMLLGKSQIASDKDVHGIKNIEEGCKDLDNLIKENKIKDKEASKFLFSMYVLLGNIHYGKRSEYKEAATSFQNACNLMERENLISEMDEEQVNKFYSKIAASFYKAQDTIKTNSDYINNSVEYQKAEQYFGEYLNRLTAGSFCYSNLNNNFVENIVNYNTSSALKIATALEMLGVVTVKNRRFETAFKCFNTSYGIRKAVQGNKIELANDLLSLGRISMMKNMDDLAGSKEYLESAYNIFKKELGVDHPKTQKERNFIDSYFGVNISSAGKYLYKGVEDVKNGIANSWSKDNNAVHNWEKEIIDDFHLIYKDLNICE